ncbi:MAG: HAMP domain-containing histidine kinase [Caulobacterales bacterium]|nr:HAMP domain-containing histidine kinase [Caulobacterales bacterium]
MRLPPVRTTWLAAIVAVFAAVALTASLAVTHGAVRSEQRQRAALAAVSDFNALLSKMDALGVGRSVVEEAAIVNWLNVFQGRPGLESSVADACSGRVANYGVRWMEAPGGRTAGFRPLAEARARPHEQLGPNVFVLTLPAGTLCPERALEVVAVRDTVGPMRVVMGRVVEPTGRAWGVAAVSVLGMAILLIGLGLASAAWSRVRMVSGVRRINLSLQKAGRGDFAGPIPIEEMTGDLQDLTREVNVTLGRLQELLAWLRDTSDQVAHDFRTPLARARARLDRFGETGDADLVDEARADLRYLTQAMNEALALRDGETWAFETLKLDDVCRAAVELYEPLAEQRRVRFETELTPAETLGVASLLQRAVANLVDNAVKYSPDGGVVRLKSFADPDGAVVIISDQGPGMEMTQSRSQPDVDSHRMGLAFVRAIVRRHGGELLIESDSAGSIVTMRV